MYFLISSGDNKTVIETITRDQLEQLIKSNATFLTYIPENLTYWPDNAYVLLVGDIGIPLIILRNALPLQWRQMPYISDS